MPNRLALVGCRTESQGPWLLRRGDERFIRVSNLGSGQVAVVFEDGSAELVCDHDGTFPFPSQGQGKYAVWKTRESELPTSVQIVVFG